MEIHGSKISQFSQLKHTVEMTQLYAHLYDTSGLNQIYQDIHPHKQIPTLKESISAYNSHDHFQDFVSVGHKWLSTQCQIEK